MVCHTENINPMNKLGTFQDMALILKINKEPWGKRVYSSENVLEEECKIYIIEVQSVMFIF